MIDDIGVPVLVAYDDPMGAPGRSLTRFWRGGTLTRRTGGSCRPAPPPAAPHRASGRRVGLASHVSPTGHDDPDAGAVAVSGPGTTTRRRGLDPDRRRRSGGGDLVTGTPGSHHDWTGLELPRPFPVSGDAGDRAGETRPASPGPSSPPSGSATRVPTPSALVGALSSVFWKPQFRWVVEAVDVLRPITLGHPAAQRGQHRAVDSDGRARVPLRRRRHAGAAPDPACCATSPTGSTPTSGYIPRPGEQNPAKWRDQFHRRVARGAYYRPPYLGMREHVADFVPDDPTQIPDRPHREPRDHAAHASTSTRPPVPRAYTWFQASLRQRDGLSAASRADPGRRGIRRSRMIIKALADAAAHLDVSPRGLPDEGHPLGA